MPRKPQRAKPKPRRTASTKFYKLDWARYTREDHAHVDEAPYTPVPWTTGIPYTGRMKQLIRCKLDGGAIMPDLFLVHLPMFSDRMLEVLDAEGVENIVRYRVELVAPGGRVFTNYKAVNIVGAVSCADRKRSKFFGDSEPPLMEPEKLVIDARRAAGRKLFRLGESSDFILMTEPIKRALEKANLVGVRLLSLDDEAAY